MFTDNRNQENLQSAAGKPLGEISSNHIRSSRLSLSAREQQSASPTSYDLRSIDDLTTQFSQTRIGTRWSNKRHEYPSAMVSEQADAIRHLIEEVLAQDLKAPRGEKLQPDHPCFRFARQYAKKWDISDEAVESHIKLACGYLKFPVILLLNPAPTHELPFDQMVKNCKTLKWIEDVLGKIGLELADVIILDACTLLCNNYIKQFARQGRKEEAVSEAYDVTQKMLQMLKPNIILACQCSTSFPKWDTGGHVIARKLCSSMQRAKKREVRKVTINDHIINVVQAYHPSSFLRLSSSDIYESHHDPSGELLEGLFNRVYLPCAVSKSQQIIASKAFFIITTVAEVEDEHSKESSRRLVLILRDIYFHSHI